ncbi:MAG: DUF6273 domain-containing protein [Clostridiales bacterium]|nr:DUF6273 domain-containing protein [Clostridiales bacterium]
MKFDKISFGSYPQSDSKTNEPIEWLVLKTNNNKALLLSDKILHVMPFASNTDDFEKSEVRRWLNGQFYNSAFTDEEKARMVNISNNDKVSLISYEEITKALPAESLRRRQMTNVAKKFKSGFNKKTGTGNWMLRTSSNYYKPSPAIQIVGPKGDIDPLLANFPYGVVPVIIITL